MNRTTQLRAVRNLVWRDMPRKEYHNPLHADEVSQTAGRFARLMGLDEHLAHLVETAGEYHDVVHNGAKDDEEQSAIYGSIWLPKLGYTQNEIELMNSMIVQGTKMPHNPQTIEQKILADADVYNAGRDDFLLRNDMLRRELGLSEDKKWYEGSLRFLQSVHWYTQPAREHGEEMRQRNIQRVEEIIRSYG